MIQLSKFLILLTLSLLTYSSYADESEVNENAAQKWYRVEVIIFSQRDVYGEEDTPRDIIMAYPEKLIDLDNNRAGFVVLPESDQNLGPDVYSLNRTGVYEVLFHKAWLQPGLAPTDAPWISVDTLEENSSLNGSLRVYLSNYLHMESNIWRVRYSTEIEPTNAESSEREEQYSAFLNNSALSEPEAYNLAEIEAPALAPWPTPPTPPQLIPVVDTADPSLANKALQDPLFSDSKPLETSNTETVNHNLLQPSLEEDSGVNSEPRKIDEIILLKQASRLRLNKLHYFDHPKLGLLVKVSRDSAPVIENNEDLEETNNGKNS